MIKKLLFAAGLCCMVLPNLQAQTPEISRSAPFEEPKNGMSKLMLLKNGNTMLINFSKKKGIITMLFDQKHQIITPVNNEIESTELRNYRCAFCEGLFEINGAVVLFVSDYTKRKPQLYRYIIDEGTGKLLSEKLVASIDRIGSTSELIKVFEGKRVPGFYVEKDGESDYYAIATRHSLTHENKQGIKITHYTPDHEVINEGYIESPNNNYNYLDMMQLKVHQDEFVMTATLVYNTKAAKDAQVLISSLTKGNHENKGTYMLPNKSWDASFIDMKYNTARKLLYIMSSVKAKSAGVEHTMLNGGYSYALFMNTIDPQTLKISEPMFVNHAELNSYAHEQLGYKKPYYGIMQDFRLHEDGSITVLYEEVEALQTVTKGFGDPGPGHSDYSTKLRDIAVIRLSEKGEELPGSYAVAKKQTLTGWIDPSVIYGYAFNRRSGAPTHGYFSYDYIHANNRDYLIYNDYSINIDNTNESYRGKKDLLFENDAHTVLAWQEGGKLNKTYLFGSPDKKNIARFSRIPMNVLASDGSGYATILIERIGRDKKTYIAWVKF